MYPPQIVLDVLTEQSNKIPEIIQGFNISSI